MIDNASNLSETTTEEVEDRRQARCIGDDNGVFIFLAISSLTVTMSRLCLVAVLF